MQEPDGGPPRPPFRGRFGSLRGTTFQLDPVGPVEGDTDSGSVQACLRTLRAKSVQVFRKKPLPTTVTRGDRSPSLIGVGPATVRLVRPPVGSPEDEAPTSEFDTETASTEGKQKEREVPSASAPGPDLLGLHSYFPRAVLAHLRSHPRLEYHVHHTFAAAVFFDLSGFTQATEELSRCDDGAEKISANLNTCFADILPIILGMKGDVVSFSGDAVLAVWLCDAAALQRAVRAALQCCVDLLHDFAQGTVSGLDLRPHIGLGCGPCTTAILGHDPTWRYLVVGQAVKNAAYCCTLAGPGQFALCQNSLRFCSAWCRAAKVPDSTHASDATCTAYRFDEMVGSPTNQSFCSSSSSNRGDNAEDDPPPCRLEVAKTFLFPLIWASPGDCVGQLRTVSTIFVQLYPRDFGPDELETVQAAFQTLLQELRHFHGVCNKCVLDDKGLVALCLFGLPQYSHENDAVRSVLFALQLRDRLRGVVGVTRTGITRSVAFCGNVGAPGRMEYTVLGQGVNLAARLMVHGRHYRPPTDSVVLCDRETYLCTARTAAVTFRGPHTVHLKGLASPVEVYEPTGQRKSKVLASPRGGTRRGPLPPLHVIPTPPVLESPDSSMDQDTTEEDAPDLPQPLDLGEIVASADHIATVQAFLAAALAPGPSAEGDPSRVLLISGDTGVGKSMLLKVAAQLARRMNCGWMCLTATDSEAEAPPFSGVRPMFERLLEGEERRRTSPRASMRRGAGNPLTGLTPRQIADVALLAELFPELEAPLARHAAAAACPLPSSEPRRNSTHTPEVFDRLQALLLPLVAAFFGGSPFALFLDNAHYLDDQSLHLLLHVLRTHPRSALVLAGREHPALWTGMERPASAPSALAPLPARLAAWGPTQVKLESLTVAQTAELCCLLLHVRALDESLTARLHSSSGGYPRFIVDLVAAWREAQALVVDHDVARLAAGDRPLPLPRSIIDFITFTVDRLPSHLVTYLKLASVIGSTFRASTLIKCTDEATEDVGAALAQLAHGHFIVECAKSGDTKRAPDNGTKVSSPTPSPRRWGLRVFSAATFDADSPLRADPEPTLRSLPDFRFGGDAPATPAVEALAYHFKMQSMRDVVYGMLLFCERKDVHRRVADALVEEAEADLPLIANHYIKCEAFDLATKYLEMHIDEAVAKGRWGSCMDALQAIGDLNTAESPLLADGSLSGHRQRQREWLSAEACLHLGLPPTSIHPLHRPPFALYPSEAGGPSSRLRRLIAYRLARLLLARLTGGWKAPRAPVPCCPPYVPLHPRGELSNSGLASSPPSVPHSQPKARRPSLGSTSTDRLALPPLQAPPRSESSSSTQVLAVRVRHSSLPPSSIPIIPRQLRARHSLPNTATPHISVDSSPHEATPSSSALAGSGRRRDSPLPSGGPSRHSSRQPSTDSRHTAVRISQGLLQMEASPVTAGPPVLPGSGPSPWASSRPTPMDDFHWDRVARHQSLLARDHLLRQHRGPALLAALSAVDAARRSRHCSVRGHAFGIALQASDCIGPAWLSSWCERELQAPCPSPACRAARLAYLAAHALLHWDVRWLGACLPEALDWAARAPHTVGAGALQAVQVLHSALVGRASAALARALEGLDASSEVFRHCRPAEALLGGLALTVAHYWGVDRQVHLKNRRLVTMLDGLDWGALPPAVALFGRAARCYTLDPELRVRGAVDLVETCLPMKVATYEGALACGVLLDLLLGACPTSPRIMAEGLAAALGPTRMVLAELRRAARRFPVARPIHLQAVARVATVRGPTARALKAWRSAAAAAAAQLMPAYRTNAQMWIDYLTGHASAVAPCLWYQNAP